MLCFLPNATNPLKFHSLLNDTKNRSDVHRSGFCSLPALSRAKRVDVLREAELHRRSQGYGPCEILLLHPAKTLYQVFRQKQISGCADGRDRTSDLGLMKALLYH